MDYDLWKTGWYSAEPDIDYDERCSHSHSNNMDSIKGLIEELYSPDALNIEFIEEQLELLARDYGIDFNFNKPLNLQKKTEI